MAAKRSAHSLLSKETMEPVAACSAYFMSSLTLSLCNKLVFSGADFDYPFAVLAFQSMCSVVFILVPGLLGCSENVRLSRCGAPRARLAAHPACKLTPTAPASRVPQRSLSA